MPSQGANPFGPAGWTPERLGSLEGKVYVITGTTTGCGYQAAKILVSKGATVVMLNRSLERSASAIEALKKEVGAEANVSAIRLDLAVLSSVREAAAEVLQKLPHIDALICNAAIAQVAKQKLTADGFESQLGVNHYGHFLLMGLLFERIEKSKGRIVAVSTGGYKMGLKRIKFEDMNWDHKYKAMDVYCHSKLAQMMVAYELQRRVKAAGKNVQVYVCHPGASKTELIWRDNISCFTKCLWRMLEPLVAQSAEQGSYPEVMCATEPDLKADTYWGPTKRADTSGPVGENQLEAHALDQESAAKLWKLSEGKTGLAWSP